MNERGNKMNKIKKALLDKRIARFCESSAELLTDIHARHSKMNKGASRQKRKRDLEEIIAIPDLDVDTDEDDPLEDLT